MKNRLAGNCTHCGRPVARDAGIAERGPDGCWQVRHPSRGEHSCARAPQVAEPDIGEWLPARYGGRCARCGVRERMASAVEYNRILRLARHVERQGPGRTCETALAEHMKRTAARKAELAAARAGAVNEEPNECSRCGGHVAPGEGRLWLDNAADEDGDHIFCDWASRPILKGTRYPRHRRNLIACRHLDVRVCEGFEALFDHELANDQAAAEQRNAARHRLLLALQREEHVARAAPGSELIQIATPEDRIMGSNSYFLIEPADASPRRILEIVYQGADGDTWGEYNYGWNTQARVAPYSDARADDARRFDHDVDPLADWI